MPYQVIIVLDMSLLKTDVGHASILFLGPNTWPKINSDVKSLAT